MQSERDTLALQAQMNAQVAHRAYREARKRVAPALAVTDRVTRDVRNTGDSVDGRRIAMQQAMDSARAVLASAEYNESLLRATLTATVAHADTLLADVASYRVAVDSLTVAHARERVILLSALRSADTALAAEQRVSAAYKLASQCRIAFGIKCPTRTTAFVVGALATVAVVVAVR